jgi:8-hydroxy-5-deazaflavin:NADPH oxidoreductase
VYEQNRKDALVNISIIGTGRMARGIAARALAGGNTVTVLGRNEAGAASVAHDLGGGVRAGAIGEALDGDLVVLAVPYAAVDDVLDGYGGQLSGRIVVDIANPVDFSTFTPLQIEAGSAAQELATKLPASRVVKAFNTTFAATLNHGEVAGQPLDVFVAGEDEDAKRSVAQLVEAGGLRAIDAGPLARARELEALGYLHMALQQPLGTGFASAIKVIA